MKIPARASLGPVFLQIYPPYMLSLPRTPVGATLTLRVLGTLLEPTAMSVASVDTLLDKTCFTEG